MLILPEWLITDTDDPPRKDWGIRVVGGQIEDVAPRANLLNAHPEDDILNAGGQVLSPGFVNTHTHLYGVLAHGIPVKNAPDGFWPFLKDFWWLKVEDRLDKTMIQAAVDWQCAGMIQTGITSFYDCLEAPNSLPGILDVEAEVVEKFGMHAILSFEATQRSSRENGELGLQENAIFTKERAKKGGLIKGMMCFHTTFTCDREFILRAYQLAGELGCLTHMHVSEGTYEPEQALKNFGMRPILFYDSLGVAGTGTLASQCVQLDEREIEIIASHGVRVSHMPLSNCEVGGGIAPIPQMIEKGVLIGLGSDSYIDNFFEVMRGTFLIHKARQQDPRVMPASLVWRMATEDGARVLNLEKTGRIEKGWQADLQLIDAHFPTPATEGNLLDQLILYRNPEHVKMVMSAGRIICRDGQVLGHDQEESRSRLHHQAERLWAYS